VATDGNDVIDGTDASDIIQGGLGNDTLRGGKGADRYYYDLGDGADVIYDHSTGSPSEQDKLILGFGIAPVDVTLTRSLADLDDMRLGFADGGSIFLDEQFAGFYPDGIETVGFADGTVWTEASLRSFLLQSTDANDVIYGFDFADTIVGGLGDDTLNGGEGADSYYYNLGDGGDIISDVDIGVPSEQHRLVLGTGIAPGEVILTRPTSDLDDLTLIFANWGSIVLDEQFASAAPYGVERIEFADGTIRATFRCHCPSRGSRVTTSSTGDSRRTSCAAKEATTPFMAEPEVTRSTGQPGTMSYMAMTVMTSCMVTTATTLTTAAPATTTSIQMLGSIRSMVAVASIRLTSPIQAVTWR
jgi:hypothetical protein